MIYRFLSYIALGLIACYQALHQTFYTGCCRFHPTCSEYAYQAIKLHGLRIGIVLTIKRILRCHPFAQGGVDFVPTVNGKRQHG